jgi:glycosyltransferase involved in cell wall biosynthesis
VPNKLFEYAMAEIPILAFPTLEIKNIIHRNQIGIVADDFTTEALTRAVELTANIDTDSFSASLKKMKLVFNWETQEEKLVNIYNSLQ